MKKNNFDYYNDHYKFVNSFPSHKNFYTNYFSKLHITNKESEFLDLGCGTGNLLIFLQHYGFKHLTGVEIDRTQFNVCKAKLQNANLVNEDIMTFLNKNNKKYDVIFLIDVIEHINKDKIPKLLQDIYLSLKPGGKLILQCPNADSPLTGSRMRYIDYTHEISFTKESISMVLRVANFTHINFIPIQLNPDNIILKLLIPVRFIVDLIIKCILSLYIGSKEAFQIELSPNLYIESTK